MTPAEKASLHLEALARQGVEKVLRGTHGSTMVSVDQIIAMAWLFDVMMAPETPNLDQSERA